PAGWARRRGSRRPARSPPKLEPAASRHRRPQQSGATGRRRRPRPRASQAPHYAGFSWVQPGSSRVAGRILRVRRRTSDAETVKTVTCALPASHVCRLAQIRILDGPQKGKQTLLTTVAAVGSLDVSQGDRIRVYKNPVTAGSSRPSDTYSFADFDRRGAMLWLGIGFVVLRIATGRFNGLRALIGLLAS